MNGRGKSDSSVVPGKRPNNVGEPAAEAVEGRGLAKGNPNERNAFRTQSRGDAPSALERVREAATRDRKQRFTARRPQPTEARRAETRELQLPGIHAHLREDPDGEVQGAAADDANEDAGEVEGAQRAISTAPARTHPGARRIHRRGGSWAHEVLRRARKFTSHQRLSLGSGAAMAEGARTPEPEGAAALGPDGEVPRPVATVRPRLSSLSIAAPCRHNLRQEPDAVMPLVRICAGGGPKGSR
jgi:hypothetical protein